MDRIPVAGPSITSKEIEYVTDAVTTNWYGRANDYIGRFEKAFAQYVGVAHAVSLPSCTSGLHLALAALGVGPGDDVAVPEATWIASSAPVTYVGANPLFVDVDPVTWCMSPESLRKNITPRTKAVIPVDLYGGMPDYAALHSICEPRGIAIVEDAAEAIGSMIHGRLAGAHGDAATFSFHGSKTLTTGEGGMLLTNRDDLFDRALRLRDHGRAPGDKLFWNLEVAFKYKMSGMQAALGLAQLERVEELVRRKREIFAWYREELGALDGVSLNAEPAGTRNTYWMVTAAFSPELGVDKTALIEHLDRAGIDSRPFFNPLSSLPAYADSPDTDRAKASNPNAYEIAKSAVNLPSGLNLTRGDVARVADAVRGFPQVRAGWARGPVARAPS